MEKEATATAAMMAAMMKMLGLRDGEGEEDASKESVAGESGGRGGGGKPEAM